MNYFSTNDASKALFRIGDDNSTYPQKIGSKITETTDIASGAATSVNVYSFKRLLPNFDLLHRKCYVVWDITRKTKVIGPLVDAYYYEMKIKYFNSLSIMNSFYDGMTGDKFSQCGLKAENTRFKCRFNNNDSFEVSKIYPLVLNYYSCSPNHFLNVQSPITNSFCELCPSGTKPSQDRLSCVTITNANHLVLVLQSKTSIGYGPTIIPGFTYSALKYNIKAYVTDNADEATVLYYTSPSSKLYINNATPAQVFSSEVFNSNPDSGDILNTILMVPTFLSLSSNTCNPAFAILSQYVHESNGQVSIDVRIGNQLSEVSKCFVWYDDRDSVLSPDYANMGWYNSLGNGVAEVKGINAVYKPVEFPSRPLAYLGPQSQFDNNYAPSPFALNGAYKVSLEIELDLAGFNDGDGIDISCANNRADGTYGSEHVFHITRHSSGVFKFGASTGSGYVPSTDYANMSDSSVDVGLHWYKFEHHFRTNGTNVLVDMTVTCPTCTNTAPFTKTITSLSMAVAGGSRNYRFIFINKKNGADYLKIRNFSRVFDSPAPGTQTTNDCDFKYARGYTCSGSTFALVGQLNKDENYAKYLPKYASISYPPGGKSTGY